MRVYVIIMQPDTDDWLCYRSKLYPGLISFNPVDSQFPLSPSPNS